MALLDNIDSNPTRIIQINLQHGKVSTAHLCAHLTELSAYIALIQEPWVHNSKVKGFAKLSANCYYDDSCSRPRTCMVISHNVRTKPVPNSVSQDLVARQLESTKAILIGSTTYFPYDGIDPPTGKFSSLYVFSRNINTGLLAGCDANAHHTMWGSSNINVRCDNLFTYLLCTDLQVIDKGKSPLLTLADRKLLTSHLSPQLYLTSVLAGRLVMKRLYEIIFKLSLILVQGLQLPLDYIEIQGKRTGANVLE